MHTTVRIAPVTAEPTATPASRAWSVGGSSDGGEEVRGKLVETFRNFLKVGH